MRKQPRKPRAQQARRGFPSGFRKIVVGEKVYFFKVGDQFTEIRSAEGKRKEVIGNWTLKGMEKQAYLADKWTRGSDEFRREGGCECDKCDCDETHIRYSHVIYPSDVAQAVKENF
jgi:hypothetical protein